MHTSKKYSLSLLILIGSLLCTPLSAGRQNALTADQYQADFDTLWQEIAANYAYFDSKQTNWDEVKRRYRPQAAAVSSTAEFTALLERTTEELYDFHCNLNTNTDSSPVLVPTDADIWAKWRQGHAIVTEVRRNTPADRAGIQAGMEVLAINGIAVDQAVNARIGSCLRRKDAGVENWALLTLLAGRHNETRRIEVREGNTVAVRTLPVYQHESGTDAASPDLLDYRVLTQHPAIGYIRPHNSLGDTGLIAAFDKALAGLKSTQGLILDLRDTPSGGNTVVARGIMGRFITQTMFYQQHSIPAEERAYGVKRSWVEQVSPRGPFCYSRPLVVLVDHWTGSMGEGMTIGMDAMKRARTVGTEMARLLGATDSVLLPNSRIRVQYPAEKLFHVDGRPREAFLPEVYVDLLAAPARRKEDPILAAGLETLNRALKRSASRFARSLETAHVVRS